MSLFLPTLAFKLGMNNKINKKKTTGRKVKKKKKQKH